MSETKQLTMELNYSFVFSNEALFLAKFFESMGIIF